MVPQGGATLPRHDDRGRTLVEVVLVFALATGAASALYNVGQSVGFVHRNLHALVALVFLGLPQIMLRRRGNIERYGFTTHPLRLGLTIAAVAIAVVLPLFVGGFIVTVRAACAHAPALVPGSCFRAAHPLWRLPGDFPLQVAAQLVVIALPEELFFRGYVQGRLEEALPPTRTLFGARVGWAWILGAALFALGPLPGDLRAADADPLLPRAGLRLDVRAHALDFARHDLSRRLQLDHGGAERQPIVVRPAAFFDMDRTLLRCNTGTLWIRWQRERGEISLYQTMRGLGWIAQYKLSLLDMEAVLTKLVASMRGQSEGELIDKARLFFDGLIASQVAPKALQAIERHRAEGHLVAILSTSTPYVVEPLATHLGIEHAICTRMNIADGRFDGTHKKPACYGAGKVYWAEAFAREHDVDLAQQLLLHRQLQRPADVGAGGRGARRQSRPAAAPACPARRLGGRRVVTRP